MKKTILIIDDEADIRNLLADIFMDEDYNVLKAAHSEQAFSLIRDNDIDLIVLDIWLENSDKDGVEILKTLKKSDRSNIPVLMISGHGNIEMAVNAMKMGAFDFIEKPFKIDHILMTVSRALNQKELQDENARLKNTHVLPSLNEKQYKSIAMVTLIKDIKANAESDARVVVFGDIGVGKSRLAEIIHRSSKRAKHTLSYFQCETLSDSDFNDKMKNIAGTIILEQIEKLSQKSQQALLSFIVANPTVRIISTTSHLIHKMIEGGEFSSALFDRLAVLKFKIPSLNNRREDIPAIIQNTADNFSKNLNIQALTFSQEAIAFLQSYNWTANVMELKLTIEWVILQSYLKYTVPYEAITIDVADIQVCLSEHNQDMAAPHHNTNTLAGDFWDHFNTLSLKNARELFETLYLQNHLNVNEGNISNMASAIDMERTALHRKLKTLGIYYQDNEEKIRQKSR